MISKDFAILKVDGVSFGVTFVNTRSFFRQSYAQQTLNLAFVRIPLWKMTIQTYDITARRKLSGKRVVDCKGWHD